MIISVTVGLDKNISVSHHLMDIHIRVSLIFIHAGSDEVSRALEVLNGVVLKEKDGYGIRNINYIDLAIFQTDTIEKYLGWVCTV